MGVLWLKKVDDLIGPILTRFPLPLGKVTAPSLDGRSVLVVRPGGLGDAVLLLSVILGVKNEFPGVAISVLAESRNAAIFDLIPGVKRVYCYDRPKDLLAVVRTRFDVLVDTEQWYRLSAVVGRGVRAKYRVGFGTNDRRRLFHRACSFSLEDYELDSFQRLFSDWVLEGGSAEPPYIDTDLREVAVLKERLVIPDPFVAIFPGASIPQKRWPLGRFASLAVRIQEMGFTPVFIGGPDEKEAGDSLVEQVGGINAAGKTSLKETTFLLSSARALVTGDSGVLHLAMAVNCPTISLFGCSNHLKWAPRGERHIVVRVDLPCSPCSRFGRVSDCPNGLACMEQLATADVVAAFEKVLGR